MSKDRLGQKSAKNFKEQKLLIFYLLKVFKIINFVNIKDYKNLVDKQFFQKFGKILKENRNQKGLTQEKLNEIFTSFE